MSKKYQTEEFIDGFDDDIDSVVPFSETITSYGADFPVESIVRRIEAGEVYVPDFQRKYIWKNAEASRFIESLLLGLPVPGVFLAKDFDGRHMIIDGQQRLLSIYYYVTGDFKLSGIGAIFNGMKYSDLPEEYKYRLMDSIIHATIIRQDNQNYENSSIFHIFERLNTGGKELEPQEIRNCMYPGEFQKLLSDINDLELWRSIYGPQSLRYKDQELILRFFALYFDSENYSPPMKSFLNRFMGMNRKLDQINGLKARDLFIETLKILKAAIGEKLFRPSKNFNAAIFDAITFGIAKRLEHGKINDLEKVKHIYEQLLEDEQFKAVSSSSTASSSNLRARIEISKQAFEEA
ncbi:GmrSD restriction endonuclease domain-containing protein [Pseudoalteromonas piscicida]|uniref:GmrSD restriction endonuclease domain-containing protein n=1 Tax=Pseudoalteromonas piscicida TaxID=43662 RepID=UPI0005F9F51F|nr:DUF262 domain-containing protein [Pseudoalteromonas piscicida]